MVPVNVALAAAGLRHKVGMPDADLFGPSIPCLMNLEGEPALTEKGENCHKEPEADYNDTKRRSADSADQLWRQVYVYGVPGRQGSACRVARINGHEGALQQYLHQVEWGELDLLVIDMPPGTGNVQLTISQQVVVDGMPLMCAL